ncbi:unannotated protein [freshwater metagenome]|uniref:Unannotated protein n=1 Tax=freshwater metagenome TaxID=449393 RepID=A0A6J7HMA3_9ZZZZ
MLAACIAVLLLPAGRTAEMAHIAAASSEAQAAGIAPRERRSTAPVNLTIAATGDFLIHSPVWLRAAANGGGHRYDFAPMFRYIRPYIRGADLAFCHMETPLTRKAPSGYPIFNTPPGLVRAIVSTGWDACSTASNHSLDQGQFGIDATLSTLRRHGIDAAGTARSARGARRIVLLRAKGVTVAFLAYTAVSNGQIEPHPWSVAWANPAEILSDARRARRAGADAVVVNLHWGDEYATQPSAFQVALARRLTASRDITAVIGQHAHVVEPIRRINGKLVVFGEGNLISNQTPSCCAPGAQDGLLALLRLRVVPGGAARLRRVDYVPLWVRHPDYAVLPVRRALVHGLAPAGELKASWRRTVGTVGRRRVYAPWAARRP